MRRRTRGRPAAPTRRPRRRCRWPPGSPSPPPRRPPPSAARRSRSVARRRRPRRSPAAPPRAGPCSSPSTSSRLISTPTTKKNSAIRPSLTQAVQVQRPEVARPERLVAVAGDVRPHERADRADEHGDPARRLLAQEVDERVDDARLSHRAMNFSATARKKSARVMIPADMTRVHHGHDQHAVVQEDLGHLGVGEVGRDVDVLGVQVLADASPSGRRRASRASRRASDAGRPSPLSWSR